MKNNFVKMNDGTEYVSLGNIFNIIKKNAIDKNNAMQTELFSIVFDTNDVSASSVNNYCIGYRAIAVDYKKLYYYVRDNIKNEKNILEDTIINLINVLEDQINIVENKLEFINSNNRLKVVCEDLYELIREDRNITNKKRFRDYIENNDLYMFMVDVLCYAILDNQQPIFKQDISLYINSKDLEEFISINLYDGFNYISAIKRLANKGNMFANVELGTLEYNEALKSRDRYINSFNYYKVAADLGHPKACWMVAYMIMKGTVTTDYEMMHKYLNKALELGSVPAINMKGNIYHYGVDCDKDIDEAIKWYEEAAAQGYAYAYNNLALIALEKDGEESAIKYYKRSADLGEAWAANRLGEYYRKNNDLKTAYYYYLESIKGPYFEKYYWGYYNLSKYYYLNGVSELNISKDLDKAKEYATIAYEHGIDEAKYLLEILENNSGI